MMNLRRTGTWAILILQTCLLAPGAGCSTQKSEAGQDSGAPDASSDAVVITTGPIWTDQSRVIDVGCFAFFQGSKRVRATREQLTADQLAILAGLRLIPSQATCAEDTLSCSVAITAADGTVATYDTEQLDSTCGSTKQLIPFASFNPFLQSFPCTSAKQSVGVSADGGATLLPVPPDPRCYNGVFTAPPNTVQRLLVVDDPSVPRHIELDSCNGPYRSPGAVHPQLLAPDGTTTLSAPWMTVTDPGADGTCQTVDYTFPAAGAYVLTIDIDAGFSAGDFFLRFY
jgi:hypothetical protein